MRASPFLLFGAMEEGQTLKQTYCIYLVFNIISKKVFNIGQLNTTKNRTNVMYLKLNSKKMLKFGGDAPEKANWALARALA